MPCYRQAHFLGESIESILSQTCCNTEIIVVDDGSPDDVKAVTDRYPGARYLREANLGLSSARNNGLSFVNGDYVVFLDADDRLVHNAFEIQLNHLNSHPECLFVSGQNQYIDLRGNRIETPPEPLIQNDHYRTLLHYNYIGTAGAVMFRKKVFENGNRFTTSLKSTGDWDLYLRITRDHAVYCHPEVVIEYRRHEGNMTNNPALLLRESLATLRRQRKYIKGKMEYEEALKKGIRGVQDYYGEPLVDEVQKRLETGEWKKAMAGLICLMRYYPAGLRSHLYPRLYRSAMTRH